MFLMAGYLLFSLVTSTSCNQFVGRVFGNEAPLSLASNTYCGDSVFVVVESAKHMRSRDTTDIVLSRFSAKEHDDVNALW